VHVTERGSRAAHHHDPAADHVGIDHAVQHVRERDGRNGSGRPAVVDPGAAVLESGGVGLLARQPLGRDDGDAVEAADVAWEAGDRAARVVVQVGCRRLGLDGAQVLVAAEDLRAALAVALACGEHGAAGVADRVEEREVVVGVRLLGELDVVDDLARAGLVEAADDTRVELAPERPLNAQLVEGLGVDSHHEEAGGGLAAADVEAGLERLTLERLEHVELAYGDRREKGDQRDDREGREAAAGGGCTRFEGHGPS
jgi:hypothetical protein